MQCHTILEQETCGEEVGTSLIKSLNERRERPVDEPGVYRGNQNDVGALVAAIMAITLIASCSGGIYCFPVIGFILGVVFLMNAPQAINPQRTRIFAGISLGISGLILLAIFCFVAFYVFMIALAVSSTP